MSLFSQSPVLVQQHSPPKRCSIITVYEATSTDEPDTNDPDSDDDGVNDWDEIDQGLDPNDTNTDNDKRVTGTTRPILHQVE